MLAFNRPALLLSGEQRLDEEYRSARWAHHKLLDFEAEHQRVLDAVAEEIAPGILRVGRIVARLSQRSRRAERTTKGQWCPPPHAELCARLRGLLVELREKRNADPRWRVALDWADAADVLSAPKKVRRRRAKPAHAVKRRKSETDEAFAKRFALLTSDETEEHYAAKVSAAPRDSRRDTSRKQLYQQRRCYWGTWNALLRRVDQARKDVLAARKQGLPAEIRRPRLADPTTLAADAGGFRIVERGSPWWVIEMRIGLEDEWVRIRTKVGNWHAISPDAKIVTAQLTRRGDRPRRGGQRWAYGLSLVVDITKSVEKHASRGVVSFDWGHREHGHDRWREGIRVFTWLGDDGARGEVLLPAECRQAQDEIDALKARMDDAFNARKKTYGLRDDNRYTYRRRLMSSGVRTEEQVAWLRWETRYELRVLARRKRIQNLRKETYVQAVLELRGSYAVFAFEDESIPSIRRMQKDEQMLRRRRSNRDLAARYEFVSLCERHGAEVIAVPARNTTKECPDCAGLLNENGPELVVVCPSCGTARDKDHGAARVILARAKEALANRAA